MSKAILRAIHDKNQTGRGWQGRAGNQGRAEKALRESGRAKKARNDKIKAVTLRTETWFQKEPSIAGDQNSPAQDRLSSLSSFTGYYKVSSCPF